MRPKHALAVLLSIFLGLIAPIAAERVGTNSLPKGDGGKATISVTDMTDFITPQDLVNSILGGGIQASNIVYTGSPMAGGIFSGGIQSGLGIEQGIILSTGSALLATGPNSLDNAGWSHGLPGDADLTALVGGATNDACILEFDFIPQTANFQLNFVLGSEEYEEYVEYADVFAFYVNGQNIALIPGTATPITIGTVNQNVNSAYYVSNYPAPGIHDIECDGFTIPITLNATVIPNAVNHIKLAVADFSDTVYDTWIFVNGESIVSGYTVLVESTPSGAAIYKDGGATGMTTPAYVLQATGTTSTYHLVMDNYTFAPASVTVENITANQTISFTGTMDPEIIVYESVTPPPGVTITSGGTIPPELQGPDPGQPAVLYTVEATGTWDVYVVRPIGWFTDWYCWLKVGGVLYSGYNPNPWSLSEYKFDDIPFGSKAPAFVMINDNMTLPVELSSFTATQTAQNFVKLSWVSQSETGLLGYRVYRNETNSQEGAAMITPTLVPATNTSTTQTYSITDGEVSDGHTYWYWLESVDYNSSQFHGPVSVLVESDAPPVHPAQTGMSPAYPNPFRATHGTTISVDVKDSDAGTVSIYNLAGQKVISYPVRPGINTINWNGRDSHGTTCSAGIYLYRLNTPSCNQTRKLVIIK